MEKYKIPVILYESEEQVIPYIEVGKEDEMAPTIFIQEYKETSEVEPGSEGEDLPVVDMVMHMFVDMDFLSKKLGAKTYDLVRTSIGLNPVKQARQEGRKILDKVFDNANKNFENAWSGIKDSGDEEDKTIKQINEKLTGKFFKKE